MPLLHEALTRRAIGCFYTVYSRLDYGLLENAYVGATALELEKAGFHVSREVPVAVEYDGVIVGSYRIDLLVERVLVIEVKTGTSIAEQDERQLRNHLRCSNLEVGLLFNFGPTPRFRRLIYSNDRKRHEVHRDPRQFRPIPR